MYVCMYVCMFVCMYVCVCECVYVCMHVKYIQTHLYVRLFVYTLLLRISMFVYIVHAYIFCLYVYACKVYANILLRKSKVYTNKQTQGLFKKKTWAKLFIDKRGRSRSLGTQPSKGTPQRFRACMYVCIHIREKLNYKTN